MQRLYFLSMLVIFPQFALALSSNNTCLPVLAEAVDTIGVLNENINSTILRVDDIKEIVAKILNETLPTILKKWDETAPKVLDKMDSITGEIAAVRKLADERTGSGFVIGTTIGAAVSAAVFGAIAFWSASYLKTKWFHKKPQMKQTEFAI